MKKLVDKKINIVNQYKRCPFCRAKLKDIKVHDSKNVRIERPVFSCDCIHNMYKIKEMRYKEAKYKEIMDASRIDYEFKVNKFKMDRPELSGYYENQDWIKKGKSVLIFGKPGNHKTGNTCLIAKKAAKKLYSVFYMRASELPDIFITNKTLKAYAHRCSLVILDNIGKHRIECTGDLLFNFVDYRIHNKKSIIGITNGKVSDMGMIFSEAMMSRLRGKDFEKVGPIGEAGQDLRQGKTAKDKPEEESF